MSPIHDRGYRPFSGPRLANRAWWIIARTGVMTTLRRRRFLALLLMAWSPFVVRAVQIYLSSNFQVDFFATGAETFREFLGQQRIFVFFVTVYVGAGLIADDRRANALQIYLSKPLTRPEYVIGKAVVLLTFLLGITLVPAAMLLILQIVFSGSVAFVVANLWLIPAIGAFSVIQALVSTLGILALSSLSTNSRFVSVIYASIAVFSGALAGALSIMTGVSAGWLSPGNSLEVVGDVIFGMRPAANLPVPVAVAALVTMLAGCLVILERRVNPVDVVTS